jgi:REP element-mobilizing transposase RayT
MGRSRYQTIDTHPHFITCTLVNWLMLFSQPELVAIALSCLKFLQSHKRLTLHAYVIMENHLHLIATANHLSKEMQSFKSFSAKQMIQFLEQNHQTFWLEQLHLHKRPDKVQSTYQVWQEGFHPQMIQHAEMLKQKLEYIHNNPVRRGYVDEPCHWRYSSARNYAGQPGILEVEVLEI